MISIDGYNWGTAQSWSRWQGFEQVFGPAYAALGAIDKPLFIPEFSSTEHGGDKAAWIKDMFAALPVKFPRIFALMWFSQSKSAEADWAVNTSAGAVAAWKEAVAAATAIQANRAPARRHSQGNRSPASGFKVHRGAEKADKEGRVFLYRVDGIPVGKGPLCPATL